MALRVLAVAAFLASVGPFAILRAYARHLRSLAVGDVDKLHRLNKATVVVTLVVMIAITPVAFGASGSLIDATWRTSLFVRLVVYLATAIIVSASTFAGMFPLYKELRRLDQSSRAGLTRWLAMIGFVLLPMSLLVGVTTVAPQSMLRNPLLMCGLRLGVIVTLFPLVPLFLPRLFGGRSEIDPALKLELIDLCRDQGFEPRDIVVVRGREGKVANALFVGIVPRFRYIVVTDYLVDEFSREEVRAVIAHELGHACEHHL